MSSIKIIKYFKHAKNFQKINTCAHRTSFLNIMFTMAASDFFFFLKKENLIVFLERVSGGEQGRTSLPPLPEIIQNHVRGLSPAQSVIIISGAQPAHVVNHPMSPGCHLLTSQC